MTSATKAARCMVCFILLLAVACNINAQQRKNDVELVGITRHLPLTGSYVVYPDTTVIIEDARISKRLLYRGDTLKIRWKTKRSDGIFFNHEKQIYPSAGDRVFKPAHDTTIILSVIRRYGITDTLSIFHITVKEPYISYFWGENSMLRGDKAVLTWNVNGGDSVSIVGVDKELPRKGLLEVRPEKTTTYTLRVKDGEKILAQQWKIIVYPFRKYISSTRHIGDVPGNEQIEMDIISVDRSGYPEELLVRAVAVDTSGNYISGLAPPLGNDSISKVYFKTVSETIDNTSYFRGFSVAEIQESASMPYDISMVLDYSGSMIGTIDYLEESLKRFILRKYLNDRISITKFDDKINTDVPLLSDSEEIFDYFKFKRLSGFGGRTALYAAADKGLMALDSSSVCCPSEIIRYKAYDCVIRHRNKYRVIVAACITQRWKDLFHQLT